MGLDVVKAVSTVEISLFVLSLGLQLVLELAFARVNCVGEEIEVASCALDVLLDFNPNCLVYKVLPPQRIVAIVQGVFVDASVVNSYFRCFGLLNGRPQHGSDDKFFLKFLVKLKLSLHVLLPLVGLSGQIADEDFPYNGAQQFDFARNAAERKRPQHRNRHFPLVQNLEEVDCLFFGLYFFDLLELGVAKEMSEQAVRGELRLWATQFLSRLKLLLLHAFY